MVGSASLAKHRAEDRLAAERARLEALAPLAELLNGRRADLQALGHPMAAKRWAAKLTLADYGQWWIDNPKATGAELTRALAKLQIALGIETAALARKDAEGTAAVLEATEKLSSALQALAEPALPAEARTIIKRWAGEHVAVISARPKQLWSAETQALMASADALLAGVV